MIGPLITLVKNEIRRIWCFRWLVAFTTVLLACGAVVAIRLLPNTYDAWGQIYVAPQTPLVSAAEGVSLVGSGYGSPYVVLTTLLNDDNLEKIVRRIDPAAASKSRAQLALAVAALRLKIQRAPDPGEGFIELHVIDTDPVRARDIVQLLMDQFIDTNVGRSQRDLGRAGAFLDEQITSYASMIEGSQARLVEFRQLHPEVARLTMANGPAGFGLPPGYAAPAFAGAPRTSAVKPDSAVGPATISTPAAPTAAELRVAELEAKLAALRTTYTERYPDVVATSRQLAEAMAVRDSERSAAAALAVLRPAAAPDVASAPPAPRRVAPPAYGPTGYAAPPQVLAPQLPPDVAAAWVDLQKSDELLRTTYQQLLAKQAATRMSQAVYQDDEAGKYQVVRQPVVPVIPSGPNRLLYAALAVMLSIGAGVAVGYLRAAMKGIMVSRQELEDTFQLPVIGTVSWEPAWHAPRPPTTWLGRVAARLPTRGRSRRPH